MTMPSELLQDICEVLWEHVKAGRTLPADLMVCFHDGIADLHEAVLAGEASTRALLLMQGDTNAPLPDLPSMAERRARTWERDGNVVRLPVSWHVGRPSQLSGCFRVSDGGEA